MSAADYKSLRLEDLCVKFWLYVSKNDLITRIEEHRIFYSRYSEVKQII